MSAVDALGWLSSVVLLVTIGKQIHKQWRSGTSEGVSTWLFIGQVVASTGFTIYSWLVNNWVFVVTNALMVVNALVGFWLTRRQHHDDPSAAKSAAPIE
jgi:MtN3 and saliva related transmembrane protein